MPEQIQVHVMSGLTKQQISVVTMNQNNVKQFERDTGGNVFYSNKSHHWVALV